MPAGFKCGASEEGKIKGKRIFIGGANIKTIELLMSLFQDMFTEEVISFVRVTIVIIIYKFTKSIG